MSNLARQRFRVEYYGSYWIVWTETGASVTCVNVSQLTLALKGKGDILAKAQVVKPQLSTETVEEFLARGGSIKKGTVPKPSAPTLASLGLIEAPVPGVPVYSSALAKRQSSNKY